MLGDERLRNGPEEVAGLGLGPEDTPAPELEPAPAAAEEELEVEEEGRAAEAVFRMLVALQ